MIYEVAYIVRPDASEEVLASVKNAVLTAINEAGGEMLVNDTWGVKSFAQPTDGGLRKGSYHYVMYRGEGSLNTEIERRFRINENVVRFMVCRLGDNSKQAELVKDYKNPNHSNVQAGSTDEDFSEDKERKMHSKKRSCWFSAKKISPDWKDPRSYSWLVNEFGKISPARVSGLTPKFQRKATDAIKRGRNMCLISYVSNEVAR